MQIFYLEHLPSLSVSDMVGTYNHIEVMGRHWLGVGGVALVSASVAN